jgi:cation:H+ antiporter
MHELLLLVGGGILLALGAELLVRGSTRLALSLGVAPMVVGLTVVAFGTSTPELAASVAAQVEGRPGIALANIVGSNIANVGLILAVAGLIAPLPVQAVTIRRDLPILGATTVVFAGVLVLGKLGRVEGAALLCGLAAFTGYQVRGALAERKTVVKEEFEEAVAVKGKRWSAPACGAAIVVGLVLLAAGGSILVDGAVLLARRLSVSERVIGLTIVAVGTSLPELAASLVAVVRKEVDVAVGNIVGSNLFNILGIGGAVALVSPASVPESMVRLDTPVLVASTAVACLFLWTGRTFSRIEGALLLLGYGAYVWTLIVA